MEFRRRIIWDGEITPEPTPVVKPSYTAPQQVTKPVLASAPVQVTIISVGKNGHKSEYKRPMTADEKKAIRKWWLTKGGCCSWDSVVEFRKEHLPPEVAIFQVVGFITTLHKALAKGAIDGINIAKYNEHRKARGQTLIKVKLPDKISPKFTVLPKSAGKSGHSKYLA